jgi:hypothetical protein
MRPWHCPPPEYLTACVRRLLETQDALILTEVSTNSKAVAEHLRANRPGSAPKFSTLRVHPDGQRPLRTSFMSVSIPRESEALPCAHPTVSGQSPPRWLDGSYQSWVIPGLPG